MKSVVSLNPIMAYPKACFLKSLKRCGHVVQGRSKILFCSIDAGVFGSFGFKIGFTQSAVVDVNIGTFT